MTGTEGIQLLQSFSNAVAELADAVSPSVVNIGTGRRSGTGVVWSDGLIVTASHVIGGAEDPTVVLSDGRELKSKVVGRDNYTDVALLRVEEDGLKPIQTGSSGETRVGQFVLAMANAFGSKPAATWGIVTSRSRSMRGWWGITIEDAVVTDAKLNPGYSGGPLVDASGRMLGMNVAYFAGRGVAVSIDSLKDIVGKLSKDGRIKKGFLGVVVEPVELPDEVATSQGVDQEEGLLVRAVEPGSPARNAGVTIGDVILRLGDAKATDEYQLHRALSGEVVGRTTSLWVLRGEKLTELKITPKEASE
ncbi:MAG TPA: trypsin-like peptidase domain-containing protein [Nitrososphaerales archaeon]|nr:trypsin-like peptidase domain-containing protein [Nitrososphaerales archaeon]